MKKSILIIMVGLAIALLVMINITFNSFSKANQTNDVSIQAGTNEMPKASGSASYIIVKPIPGKSSGSVSLEEAEKLGLIIK